MSSIERLVETRIQSPSGLVIVRPFEDFQGGRGVQLDFESEEKVYSYPELMVEPLMKHYADQNCGYMVRAILAAVGRRLH